MSLRDKIHTLRELRKKLQDLCKEANDEVAGMNGTITPKSIVPKDAKPANFKVDCLGDLVRVVKEKCVLPRIDNEALYRIATELELIHHLIGMKELKKALFAQLVYILQRFHSTSDSGEYLNTVIMGVPGVGKSIVAELLGQLYAKLRYSGAAQDGQYKLVHRDDLVGRYVGQTAPKTRALLESCVNGCLVIDEAYSLSQTGERDFANEAVDTLVGFLSQHKKDIICILVGYREDLEERFFPMNAGLRRRFPWTFVIHAYTPDELMDILQTHVARQGWKLADGIAPKLVDMMTDNKLVNDQGGFIENWFARAKMMHSQRIINEPLDSALPKVLTLDDFKDAIKYLGDTMLGDDGEAPADKDRWMSMFN